MSLATTPARAGRRRTRKLPPFLAALLAVLSIGSIGVPTISAVTKIDAGYRDSTYGNTSGADDVTVSAAQSKLWFNDGRWFANMFDPATKSPKFRVYSFNEATQDFTSTGVAVDDRDRSLADVLSVGNTVYIASSHPTKDLRFYRLAYNTTTHTYAVTVNAKVIPNTSTGTLYATIARSADHSLWMVYQQGLRIWYTASSDEGINWTTPAQVPGQLNDTIAEDTSAVTAVSAGGKNGVEVMWGNQNPADDSFHSAIHIDGDPVGTWQPVENVLGTPGTTTYTADNHISLKTAPDGEPIAAIKTARNLKPGGGGDPLIAVEKRTGDLDAAGTWTIHTVTTVATHGTRPMLVIDDQNSEANVFLTDPTLASDGRQAIYRRTAPIGSLAFGAPSLGTRVIYSATVEAAINDATSTKQAATAASGMLVLATDIPTRRYLHACIGDPCPAVPVANFTATPTTGAAPLNVQFTDTSTGAPTSWLWDFGDGTTATVQNPNHAYAEAGTYDVTLTATSLAGSDPVTKSGFVTVTPPPQNAFFPIDPVRVLDSRSAVGLTGAFSANTARTVAIGGAAGSGVPADAIAVTGNLTVVNQTKPGYLSIGPVAGALGATSSLNFPTGDTRANGVTVPLSDTGGLSIVYKAPTGSTAHVVFDVTGYFRTTTGTGDTYVVVNPVRLLDTRGGNGLTGKFAANTPRTWQIASRLPGAPANVTAITANVTVVGQTKAGYVSLGPVATATPAFSTINFPTGDVRANGVTVKLSGTGTLSAVYKAPSGTTDLILDVTGYFTSDATGTRFVPVSPSRLLDTRGGVGLSGKFSANTARTWAVGNHGGVAPDAVAVVGNVTVVNQTQAGYVAVTPTATNTPSTSTINFPAGDVRCNGMTVKLTAGNLSAVYKAATGRTTDLVFDVFGYYK